MKNVIVCFFVLLIAFSENSFAGNKARIDKRSKQLIEQVNASLRSKLEECQGVYQSEMIEISTEIDADAAYRQATNDGESYDMSLLKSKFAVQNKKQKDGYEYVKCENKAQDDTSKLNIEYIKAFPNRALVGLAKEVISQWNVALKSVGSDSYANELSKFDKSVSDIQLEMSLEN